jgi:hypothetical protein
MHKWSAYKPDLVSVRSVFDRERMEHFGIAKKEAIHITGSVGSDDAAEENQKIDRDELCKKYGLKSSKKICVFMSSGPALHTEEVKKYYVQICDIINQIPDFNLLIKPHPREYLKEKQHTRYENNHDHTWEQLAPGIPVCDAEDKFDCLRHCDVLVSQGLTSTFIETALLHKPIIYVAIPEGYVQARGIGVSSNDLRPYISNERFTLPGRKVWHELGCLYPNYKEILPPGPLLDWAIQLDNKKSVYFPTGFPEYIGSECSLDELYEVLSSGSYQFNDSDVYDKHIAEFSYANDGKAYKRLADVVDLVEQTPAYSSKIVRLYRSRWFRPVRRIGRIVRTLPERIA